MLHISFLTSLCAACYAMRLETRTMPYLARLFLQTRDYMYHSFVENLLQTPGMLLPLTPSKSNTRFNH